MKEKARKAHGDAVSEPDEALPKKRGGAMNVEYPDPNPEDIPF